MPMAGQAMAAQATAGQANVMLRQGERQLRPALFRGMAADDAGSLSMREAEPQRRSADDLRRATQMTAAQRGDRAAYEALLRDCVPLIRAFALRRGVAASDVDDVVQNVLLTIHRARQTYDSNRAFGAWLRAITERRAIDLLRRVGRQRAREVHAPLALESFADDDAGPAARSNVAAGRGLLQEALATLPERQREAVQTLVLEEQSLADAAAVTRRSKGALKVNLHRALKALRGRFNKDTVERS
jgi:RNA polymerase sigma factor (sigma-70 family)